jgi:hypothetical protein
MASMRAVVSMTGAGFLSWAGIAASVGGRANPEVLYGMLGPLVVVVASWLVVRRAYVANPAAVMGVLVTGMAIKLIFLATYAFVMLRVLDARPIPFVASFACYFIVLHHIEALFMKRLFTSEC